MHTGLDGIHSDTEKKERKKKLSVKSLPSSRPPRRHTKRGEGMNKSSEYRGPRLINTTSSFFSFYAAFSCWTKRPAKLFNLAARLFLARIV